MCLVHCGRHVAFRQLQSGRIVPLKDTSMILFCQGFYINKPYGAQSMLYARFILVREKIGAGLFDSLDTPKTFPLDLV